MCTQAGLAFSSLWGCKLTDNQCSLCLSSPLRWRNQSSHQWFLRSHKRAGPNWAGPFAGQRSAAICLMYWRSHFLYRVERRWHAIDDFMPLAHASPPPYFCLCAKSKSSLAKWQTYTGRESGLSEMVSITSGQYVRRGTARERERARDNLFESSILCRSLLIIGGKKGDCQKVFLTQAWSKARWHRPWSGNNVYTAQQRVPPHFIFPT